MLRFARGTVTSVCSSLLGALSLVAGALAVAALSLAGISVSSVHAKEIGLSDAVKLDSGFRWRWQSVDDEYRGDAIAHTLKARVSVDAGFDFAGLNFAESKSAWRLYSEFDGVFAFNDGNYNSGTFNPGTSLIPDPQGAELNQFYLQYNDLADWRFRLGRQAISYDDERFIGRIAFWQNDQTFDALTASYNNLQNLRFDYAYLDRAQRIFGNGAGKRLDTDDVRFQRNPLRPLQQLGEHQHSSHLFNVRYTQSRSLILGAYGYLIENKDQLNASSRTFGVQASGTFKPGKIKYEYELQWANQKGAYDNPWNYSANFQKLSGSAQYRSHALALAWEKLGADDQAGFQTPLADNHRHLGWADIFNNYRLSPGLQDYHLTYKGRKGKLRWQLVYHVFKDASGDIDAGNELDIELAYRHTRKWEFKLISANYRAKSGFADLPESQVDLSSLYLSVNYNI